MNYTDTRAHSQRDRRSRYETDESNEWTKNNKKWPEKKQFTANFTHTHTRFLMMTVGQQKKCLRWFMIRFRYGH